MGRVTTPYEGSGHRDWGTEEPVPAPLRLHHTTVSANWVDYNGHMSESCYLLVFGDNSDAFFRFLGISESYRVSGNSLYTVETHLHNQREVAEGEPLEVSLQLLDFDAKRVHVFHEMRHGRTSDVLATAEQMLLHVDTGEGRVCPMGTEIRERLAVIHRTHQQLSVPESVGKPMGIRRA